MKAAARATWRVLRVVLAGVVVLVLAITALGAVASLPASAAPPDDFCMACPPPGDTPPGTLFDAAETIAAERSADRAAEAERNQYVTGLEGPGVVNPSDDRTRETFWDSDLEANEFDIEPYKIHYSYDTGWLGIPQGDTALGALADLCFEGYKTGLHVVNEFIGWFVFGLVIIHALMGPALDVAESFQSTMIGPFSMWSIVLGALVIYIFVSYLRRRMSDAVAQSAVSLPIVALGALLVPIEAIRWTVSLGLYVAVALMIGGSGGDPTTVPGPSGGPIDVSLALTTWNGVSGNIEDRMIAKPAEFITFGGYLPEECQAAYAEGRNMRLPASDGRALEPLQEIEACRPYAEYAANASSSRVGACFFLIFLAWVYILGVLAMALYPILGQIRVVGFTGAYYFILMFLALPGGMAASAFAFAMKTLRGILHIALFGIAMLMTHLGMNAILIAGADWALWAQLLSTLSIPLLIVIIYLTSGSRQNAAIKRAAQRIRPARERSHLEQRARWETKQLALRGAHMAAKTGYYGAAVGLYKVRKNGPRAAGSVKRGLVGTDEKRGLFYGPVPMGNTDPSKGPIDTRNPRRNDTAPAGDVRPDMAPEAPATAQEFSDAPARTLAAYRAVRRSEGQPDAAREPDHRPSTAPRFEPATTPERGWEASPSGPLSDEERMDYAVQERDHRMAVNEDGAKAHARRVAEQREAIERIKRSRREAGGGYSADRQGPQSQSRPQERGASWSWDADRGAGARKPAAAKGKPAGKAATAQGKGAAKPAAAQGKGAAKPTRSRPRRSVAQGAVPQVVIYGSKSTARAGRAIASGFRTQWKPNAAEQDSKASGLSAKTRK